jgi:C4-dicarboxylate transporter DctM subunit
MNLVHFGVLEAVVITIGLFTPPVGVGMFLICKVAQIKTESFLREMQPFLIALFAFALLVAYIPALSLWLPSLLVK